jgi:hypothetical protein
MRTSITIIMLVLAFLFLFSYKSFNQLTNKWEFADTTEANFWNYYTINGHLAGFDENSIVVIGGEHHLMKLDKNKYKILKFTNRGKVKTVIYADSTNYSHRFLSIAHPSKKLIVVVGDSAFYQGNFPYGQTTKKWYMYFGQIILSTDGGQTWNKRTIDSNKVFRSISMCDSVNGIILQYDYDNYYNQRDLDSLNNTLLITNDCWDSYRYIYVPKDAGYNHYSWCLTPDTYYLLCQDRETREEFFYITNDGGENWKQSNRFADNIDIQDFVNINNKKMFSAAGREIKKYSPSQEPIIYKSVDGGYSWDECENVYRDIYDDMFIIKSIDFCDSLNGIAVGSEGKILRTSDGGDTWQREYAPFIFLESHKYNYIQNIIYPNKEFAFALWKDNYMIKCENEKTLEKPKFFDITNSEYQSVDKVHVKWTAIQGADYSHFRMDTIVYNRTIDDFDFDNPLLDTIMTDTSIIFQNLEYNRHHKLWVKAINDSVESDWSEYDFITIAYEDQLIPPELLYPAKGSKIDESTVTLVWTKIPLADSYQIEISNSEDDNIITDRVADTIYSLSELIPSTYYYVSLKSYKGQGYSRPKSSFFGTREVLPVYDERLNLYEGLSIVPNPVSQNCYIIVKSEKSTGAIMKLYSILGSRIKSFEYNLIEGENTIPFETENLSTGLYSIEVITSNKVQRGLFVKK